MELAITKPHFASDEPVGRVPARSGAAILSYADIVDSPSAWPLPQLLLRKRCWHLAELKDAYGRHLPCAMENAKPARQYEYLLGRLAATSLFTEFEGDRSEIIPKYDGGRPVWPAGYAGSIAHTDELLAVTLTRIDRRLAGVGIDIEDLRAATPITEELRRLFTRDERRRLDRIYMGEVIGFALKEALFKCINPLFDVFLEFEDVELHFIDGERAHLVLARHVGECLPLGSVLEGVYSRVAGHVWAGVLFPGEKKEEGDA